MRFLRGFPSARQEPSLDGRPRRVRAGLGLRASLVALALAANGCRHEEPAPSPADTASPAPTRWFQGRLRQMPAWAEDLRARRDPARDGWPTEAWAEWIERELPARVRGSLGSDEAGLPELFAEGFAGSTELWPADLESVFDDGNLSVRRSASLSETLLSKPEFARLAGAWKASLAGARDLRVDVDVDGLTPLADDRFEARVRMRVVAASGGGALQQNLRWRTEWNAPASGSTESPRLAALVLERCEEIRARARPFAELTRAVFAPVSAFAEEILRGSEDYHLRQDRLSSQPFLGMHGLAVGDVDGDGLEDLYVPQPGGQPNRLLLHQPDGTLKDGTVAAGLDILDNCGPALILDLDDDGDQDVAVAAGSRILIGWNDGHGRFPAHTVLSGPDAPEITSMSAADVDGDGDLDLYACRYAEGGVSNGAPAPYWNAQNGARNLFWRNEGNRRFVESAAAVGLDLHATRFSLALLFEDFDGDGDVDLYVINDFGKNALYRNEGGVFRETAEGNGADDPAAGMGVSAADVDRDGNLDLFVTNMDSPAGSRIADSPKFLPDQPDLRPAYRHHARGSTLLLGDGRGNFQDATDTTGVAPSGWAWGGTFFDLQNDGWPDLVVPNGFATNRDPNDLRGFFWRCVIARTPRDPPPPQVYLDAWDAIRHFTLFEGGSWNGRERNFAYLNLGGLRFSEASGALGVDFLDDARLVAPMDWDDDGRVDLWLRNRTGPRLRFLRNVQESAGHSIAIDLACPEKNRDAIGARVTVHAGGSKSTSTVYAAQGFMAAPSRRLHFGLGAATKAERVEIRWPDGGTDSFSDVPADARYRIVQGTGKIERVPRRPHPALGGQAGVPVRVPPGEMSRIVLYERLPAAAVDLPSTAQPDRTVGSFSGKPLLAVLVRAGDPASEHALKVLAGKHKVFEALGVPRVVLVEGDGDAAADAAAGELVARLGFADLAGAASRRFLRTLQVFLVEILGPFDRLPYPLALLFDGAGALTVVYTGALPFDAIASDAASTRDLDPKTSSTEPLLGGRWAQAYSRNLEGVAQIFDVLGEVDLGRTYHRLAAARAGR